MAIQYLTDDVRVDSGNYPVARPSVGGQSDGSWLVAWEALTESFDAEGDSFDSVDIAAHAFRGRAPRGSEEIINAERRDGQFDPLVAARGDGTYVVAYSSGEENRLPGTYAASTVVSSNGQPFGTEVLGRDTNYNHDPDVALLPGGGYVLVSTGEDQGAGQVHAASGEILATFGFGFTGQPPAVSSLAGGAVLLVWDGFVDAQAASGFDSEGNPVESIEGIYAQVRDAGGALGPAFLIAPVQQEFSAIAAATLADGRVAIAYTNADAGGQSVFLSYVDATA